MPVEMGAPASAISRRAAFSSDNECPDSRIKSTINRCAKAPRLRLLRPAVVGGGVGVGLAAAAVEEEVAGAGLKSRGAAS